MNATLLVIAVSVGCSGPEEVEEDGGAGEPHVRPLVDCAPGTWLEMHPLCMCSGEPDDPGDTGECQAPDCQQGEPMVLRDDGRLLDRVWIRWSAELARFSAVAGAAIGELVTLNHDGWSLDGDALVLDHDGEETPVQAECRGDELVFVEMALYERAPDGLATAILAAWADGDFLDVQFDPAR